MKLCLFPLLAIYLFLISATSIDKKDKTVNEKQSIVEPISANTVQLKKSNFFQRLLQKWIVSKNKKVNTTHADKLASTALVLGIAACAAIPLGLVLAALSVNFIYLASIPLGIGAMITGRRALRQGTSEASKAKTGKRLGLAALITMGILLVAVAIFIATVDLS